MNRLLYRRQFLLARRQIAEMSTWKHVEVGGSQLHVHPDLKMTVRSEPTRVCVLLGYWFNPESPSHSDEEILENVLSSAANFEQTIHKLKQYTGRYALLYRDAECFNIISDALALREVHYCESQNLVICGSQPNLLARFSEPKIELSADRDVVNFVKNELPRVRNGRFWPGDGTPYRGVKHLLPNRYLDIPNRKSRRYWPNAPLAKIEVNECVDKCTRFLRGAMKAAALRQPLMVAVTGGLDSRSVLAACKDIRHDVYFFINKHPPLTDESADVHVPKSMFKALGLPFHVHDDFEKVPEEFEATFLANTLYAKKKLLPVIYNVYYRRHSEKLNILGVGEIGRGMFGNEPAYLDGLYLAYTLRYRNSKHAVRQCQEWLDEVTPYARKFGLNLMTLLLWEVLLGTWGAVGNSESDIAIEEFDPYASHRMYELLLSTDRSLQVFSDNVVFKSMIKAMWPELLKFPVNPPQGIRARGRETLGTLGIKKWFQAVKYQSWVCFRGRRLAKSPISVGQLRSTGIAV